MKLKIVLLLIFYWQILNGQNDTTVYFSNLNKTCSKANATYYSKFKKNRKGESNEKDYVLNNGEWIMNNESVISRETDTSYIVYSPPGEQDLFIRSFAKCDSIFYVVDYQNSKITEKGYSKSIFPLIKHGHWIRYDSDGKIKEEGEYSNNQCISNKYYLPDGSFINDVFALTDKYPQFEGGDKALLQFVADNTKYPDKAKFNNITGRVIVLFIVMADGSINGIEILKGVDPILDQEAIKVISKLPKNKWAPAIIDNKKVNSHIMIPITFSLK